MQEQLISIETAKLAHSKNFNWFDKSNTSYHSLGNITGEIKTTGIKSLTVWMKCWKEDPSNTSYNRLALVPRQSFLQKWLREKHNIHIIIDCTPNGHNYRVCVFEIMGGLHHNIDERYSDFEQALEAGLQEGLGLI